MDPSITLLAFKFYDMQPNNINILQCLIRNVDRLNVKKKLYMLK